VLPDSKKITVCFNQLVGKHYFFNMLRFASAIASTRHICTPTKRAFWSDVHMDKAYDEVSFNTNRLLDRTLILSEFLPAMRCSETVLSAPRGTLSYNTGRQAMFAETAYSQELTKLVDSFEHNSICTCQSLRLLFELIMHTVFRLLLCR
jgi:hypothetical protein